MTNHHDPVLRQVLEMKAAREAAQAPPEPHERIALALEGLADAIRSLHLDVHVSNDVQPTPVHVSTPLASSKEVRFERDENNQIQSARVTEGSTAPRPRRRP